MEHNPTPASQTPAAVAKLARQIHSSLFSGCYTPEAHVAVDKLATLATQAPEAAPQPIPEAKGEPSDAWYDEAWQIAGELTKHNNKAKHLLFGYIVSERASAGFFSCAKRASDPSNEKATCLTHCGDNTACPAATEAALSVACRYGNANGVKSSVALGIVGAYVAALATPPIPEAGAGGDAEKRRCLRAFAGAKDASFDINFATQHPGEQG